MSRSSTRTFTIVTILFVATAVFVISASQSHWFRAAERPLKSVPQVVGGKAEPTIEYRKDLADAFGIAEDQIVEAGGILRPARDLNFSKVAMTSEESPPSPYRDYGRSPSLKGDENPQVAGLMKELMDPDGTNAARSSLFKPEPFDPVAYQQDPESWLNQIRPGRVFQTAQPGAGVNRLTTVNDDDRMVRMLQGERAVLRVKADPGAPVTFHTPQVGEFENRLATQTVAANADGIAEVVYTAGPGAHGLIDVMAASPVNSEQVRFLLNVAVPE